MLEQPSRQTLDSANTWCKICGITTATDAAMAEAAGADALGFNCYPKSPRYVTPEQIAQLTKNVKALRIALFVDPTAAQVDQVLQAAEIDMLQFHGDEAAPFCASFGLPYIKVLRMRPELDVGVQVAAFESAWALLLDTYLHDRVGGTGQTFDWSLWPTGGPTGGSARMILAGGLTPQNVAAAISQLNPFGVDVAGGVEGAVKGRKDPQKIDQFIQEVRRVGRKQGQ